jgi:hypothetical protein
MKTNWRNRMIGWMVVAVFLAAIVLLFLFIPLIAAAIFGSLTLFLGVAIGKAEGFRSGLKWFIKEILLGW